VKTTLMNTGCRCLCSPLNFVSFEYVPRSGIYKSYGSFIFKFPKNLHKYFSYWLSQSTFPATLNRLSLFTTTSSMLTCFLPNSHPNKCEKASHCDRCALPWGQRGQTAFHVPVSHLYVISLQK
jgi:hypothetical protein